MLVFKQCFPITYTIFFSKKEEIQYTNNKICVS